MGSPAVPYPLGNSSREQPLAALVPDKSSLNSSGRVTNLIFTPSFGGITIPVSSGVQSFGGSAASSQPGGTAGDPMGEPQVWDVSILNLANNNNANLAAYWQLRWWVKGAAFSSAIRVLDLGSVGPSALNFWNTQANGQVVVASAVEVTLWGVTNQPPNSIKPLPLAVSIAPRAMHTGAERLAWQWAQSLSTARANVLDVAGNKYLQGGSLGQFQATLKTAQTSNAMGWPMLIDVADQSSLVSGTSLPIPGTVLAGLSNIGDTASYGDEFRPGVTNWNQGLVFALSASPDVFTSPAGTPIAAVSLKVGT